MSLPFILAGPIVRRVESDLVTVWLAFSEPMQVTLSVYEGGTHDHGTQADVVFSSGSVATTPFGKHLHIIAATAKPLPTDPNVTLSDNSLYAYNVEFTVDTMNDIAHSLNSVGLLHDEEVGQPRMTNSDGTPIPDAAPLNKALGYQNGRLPTFLTCPSDLVDLAIVQGGCRNTGSNRQDAVGWVDQLIEDLSNTLGPRPHQLFLTGDQIYADSANTIILPMMNEIGSEMMGGVAVDRPVETMYAVHDPEYDTSLDPNAPVPPVEKQGANTEVEVTLKNFPTYRRGWLCKDHAEFTTGSKSHILSFGEFAAAYCLAWNPTIWRDYKTESEIFAHSANDTQGQGTWSEIEGYLTPWSELEKKDGKRLVGPEWNQQKTVLYDKWRFGIERYAAAIPNIRRALANCATYMIHDDHEVTDDWNLSKEWMNRTYGKPLGRQVLRNGMSSYALFQSWGNDPEGWTAPGTVQRTFLDNVSQAWSVPDADNHVPDPARSPAILEGLGIEPSNNALIEAPDARLVDWHYTVETPTHIIVAIDTRMKRTFQGLYGPPRLLGETTNLQIPPRTNSNDDRFLLLLAPQPPLMPALFDQIAQPLGAAVLNILAARSDQKKLDENGELLPHERAETGEEMVEGESWGLEEVGLERLLARVAPYRRVVVLSGDVHFSYTMKMDYWPGAGDPSRIIQLTISPSRHQWTKMVHVLMRTSALSNRFAEVGLPAERLGWEHGINVPKPNGMNTAMLARANRDPALLPAKGWPVGTPANPSPGPDWRWRLELVTDQREEDGRPSQIRLPPIKSEDQLDILPTDSNGIDRAGILERYKNMAAPHQMQALRQESHYRRLVFPVAIGIITFPTLDDKVHVQTDIISSDPGQAAPFADGLINTVHVVAMDPTTDPPPLIQTLGASS